MAVDVALVPEWRLAGDDEAQIAELLARSFPQAEEDFGGRSYASQRHHLRLVARDGDRTVAHLALTLRAMMLGARRIDVLGLAEVATDPDRRGEGLAGKLVDRAIALAETGPAEALALFGVARLYAGRGFVTVANPLRCTVVTEGRTVRLRTLPPPHEFMVRSARPGAAGLPEGWDETLPLDLAGPAF